MSKKKETPVQPPAKELIQNRTSRMNGRLYGTIFRVILMGAIGAGFIALITYWTQHDPRMMRDSFAYGYCVFSAVFTALFCGLMSAYQIHLYLHPETER